MALPTSGPSSEHRMRASGPYSVVALSTWAVVLTMALLAAFQPPVLGFVLVELWTLLLLSDLHTALPDDFYETQAEAVRHLAVSFVLSVALMAFVSVQSLIDWAGLDAHWLVPRGLVLAVAVMGIVVHAWVVRHVLSALETLEEGEPQRVGYGLVALNVLFPPLYVLWSHYRARRALLDAEA